MSNPLAVSPSNPYSIAMKSFKQWLRKHWLTVALIILIFALFFTIRYFIHSLEKSYSEGELRPRYYHHTRTVTNADQTAAPQVSVSDIAPWMTFNYINVVFNLPTDYLKNIFGINDPRYPNIRIDRYAKESHIDRTLLLNTIKKYITTYTSH